MNVIFRLTVPATLVLASGSPHAQVLASLEPVNSGTSDVILILKYKNTGNETVSIREADIPRTMPDGRLWSNTFHIVSSTGSVAPYKGVIVNLAPEARVARFNLEPGQETVVQVNLSQNYRLQPGTRYEVKPRGFEQRSHGSASHGHSLYENVDTLIYSESPSIEVNTGTGVNDEPGTSPTANAPNSSNSRLVLA